jgi:hypothetical protein
MALTYEQSNALMNDMQFRGRVKVACLKFADSIFNEPNTTAAHQTRIHWATNAQQQPDTVAGQVQPPTVMDAAVQAAGSAISDDALQASVEAVVNKML